MRENIFYEIQNKKTKSFIPLSPSSSLDENPGFSPH
jgi:hypothetical protein